MLPSHDRLPFPPDLPPPLRGVGRDLQSASEWFCPHFAHLCCLPYAHGDPHLPLLNKLRTSCVWDPEEAGCGGDIFLRLGGFVAEEAELCRSSL